jgi:type IV pilus assembly protein PilM
MALVVGLDIGTHFLKGAVLSGSPGKFQLVDFFVEPIPHVQGVLEDVDEGDDDETFVPDQSLDELIRNVLSERNLRSVDAIVAVDTKDCVIREITVPFTREEQLRKTVPFEAENYFHAFDLEDVVLEYVKTGESEGRSRLILIALQNSTISERLELLKGAGCDPVAMDLDGAALANAFSSTPYFDVERSTLLVDMGASSSKVVLLEGGKLKKVRSLRLGSTVVGPARMIAQPAAVGEGAANESVAGDGASKLPSEEESLEARFQEIEDALQRLEPISSETQGAEDLEDDLEDDGDELDGPPIAILPDEEYGRLRDSVREELGEKAGVSLSEEELTLGSQDLSVEPEASRGGSGTGASKEYQDYLERLAIEIQRTFATTQLGSPIELICLTGGLGYRDEARRFFSEEFDVDTVLWDFGDSVTTDLEPARMREVCSEAAVAVGLAMKGMGQDSIGIDFRKGAFRYEHRFERLKIPLLVSSILCLLLFLQTAFWAYQEYEFHTKRAKDFARESKKAYETFFGKELVAGRDPLAATKAQRKTWEGKGHSGRGRFISFVGATTDFASVLNRTNIYYQLQDLTFKLQVERSQQTRTRKAAWKGQKSSARLTTSDSRANRKIENGFKNQSEYFKVTADLAQQQDEYRVNLNLEPKQTYLETLE